jgi:membrane-associated protease RseP (regulator of RpoE activity)
MDNRVWTIAGSTAVLCAALIATPALTSAHRLQETQDQQEAPGPMVRNFAYSIGDEGGSWLGVETQEVTSEKAKEYKLPEERGALLGKIVPDSPASKGGLRANDVVTEINGQHVEGAQQFRRMIREIPSGRTVQLTVWRDGRSQTISVTLGKGEELHRNTMRVTPGMPGTFAFRMPDMPEIPDLPEAPDTGVVEIPGMPSLDWNGPVVIGGGPRLGIDAEDLSGQLGSYFGAPEGEGILVRGAISGSPAEKAGLKAGDVIISLNGERVRSVGDLRQKLATTHISKDKDKDADKDAEGTNRTVKLGVLRNKSEISLSVELPAPTVRSRHVVTHRTNI